ncbi:helix-turn-helix transcriptional regulator [Haliangium sp.]|uniref:helix-turn-helix transcriptional regulator n=1 Tax=Haliangium sp. TaxID=2663208 RepID=UPI003D11345B
MNEALAKTIGRAAREARKALALTQEDAAERIDVSLEFYARIERGKSLPSIGTFTRIVSALGVSADTLIDNRVVTGTAQGGSSAWAPAPPDDSPELRRLTRRLRKARPATLRLVTLLVKEMESAPVNDEVACAADPGTAETGPSSDDAVAG